MSTLQAYTLPIKGLGDGQYRYEYLVDSAFFAAFPDAPVQDGEVSLIVHLDKSPRLLSFQFSFSGWLAAQCDRCLTGIQLPVSGENHLQVKYGEAEQQDNEDEDVVYISPETSMWSIAQYAYEYILLALPIIKVYDCEDEEPRPCDLKMLEHLDERQPSDEDNNNNPFRDAFKDWKAE